MKKLLFCLLALLLIVSMAACASKTEEPPVTPTEPSQETEDPAVDPTEDGPQLLEVNIYHLGIRTQLDLANEATTALAENLFALLETAAEDDSMDTAPADSPNPIQVTAGRTALEVVYRQSLELPLKDGDTPVQARRLLYSVPSIGDDGGLLYVGEEIYTEMPLGKLFDPDLQQDIYNSAADQVEQVTFNGDQMEISGESFAYEKGDNAADLSDMLLNRMLYRCIAFYKNAYTGNVNGLAMMSTSALTDAVALAASGAETDNELGEENVANLNKYILADYFLPQTIMAPVEEDDGYMITMVLNERVSINMSFVVQEDMPLVSSLRIIMSDPAAETEDGAATE